MEASTAARVKVFSALAQLEAAEFAVRGLGSRTCLDQGAGAGSCLDPGQGQD